VQTHAHIGFHAAYYSDTHEVTGSGNAKVGAYLTYLGLSLKAIEWLTSAEPNEMATLTPDIAEELGIDVNVVPSDQAELMKRYSDITNRRHPAPGHQDGPSFDCRAASAPAEIAICGDAGLSDLDNQLSQLYSTTITSTPVAAARAIKTAQVRWLRARNSCGYDKSCIANSYQVRIQQLAQ
jgi:uncharacterized protein YecT (DUF1311 family)